MVCQRNERSKLHCYADCCTICSTGITIISFVLPALKKDQALHINPNDKAVVYNIAMIQQKSAEMLFALQPSKRSLKDLQHVIDQAMHAQK